MIKAGQKISIRWAGLATLAVLLTSGLLPASAWATSGGVSQGFTTNETDLATGTLMGLKPDDHEIVEQAVASHTDHLVGVVADRSLIELSDGSKQVQITISGVTEALVSNINGTVNIGDKITASPISGIGMKATDGGQVVGTAQGNLNDAQTTKHTITDKTGKTQTISIGLVPLQVSVGYYSGEQSQGKIAAFLPPSILALANSISGQPVSPLRVLIGLLALVFGFIIIVNMLQSGIRANIISVGRNPLAKKALRRELLDICTTAIGILILTLVIVYIVLKF